MHPLAAAMALAAWGGVGGVCLLLATRSPQGVPVLAQLLAPLAAHVSAAKAMYSPLAYFVLFSVVWVLERYWPAVERRHAVANFIQDLGWYGVTLVFRVAILGAYLALLYALYHEHLSFLTLDAAGAWHPALRFVAAVLVTDFMRWFAHVLMHKVPVFWEFHALHHSQHDLNIFTDSRVHPVERIIAGSIKFLPAMMLANTLPVILAWAVFETIYPKFYHANIRTNLGPLRYVLVNPQSHRVHHGRDDCYRDRNFGFTFCIWDRLFGTQYPDDTVYPETGIQDSQFPAAPGRSPAGIVVALARQFWYPCSRIAGRALGKR